MPHLPAADALKRFRVLDLTRVRAGPTAVRQLADWGADVIKIETPESAGGDGGLGGPRLGPDFQNLHRNKRSLALNLKEPDGLALFKRLAADADVVVENYRPDVKFRLGIDYETLAAINPRLVYASISGFGQDGPYAKRPGVDQIAQGLGGLMSITGEPGRGPMRVGIAVADTTAGLLAAQAILLALLQREETGKGQWVQTSLLQAQVAILDFQAARYTVAGDIPGQVGNAHPTSVPTNAYATADGYINVAAAGDKIFQRLCRAIGREDMIDDDRFAAAGARFRNREALEKEIAEALRQRPSAEWVALLNDAGVPAGPINDMAGVFADPQVQHLGIAWPFENEKYGPGHLIGQPIVMSENRSGIARPPPNAGEHSEEVLSELGLEQVEIDRLRANGII
jgi:crotonobetainyl-CoA:carnitine CoA-transferase CaiB-like acyl-CoA transferase